MEDKSKNKGLPLYPKGAVVYFEFFNGKERVDLAGRIVTVNALGDFMGSDEVSYDIYAHTEAKPEGILYKNVREDFIKKVICYKDFSADEEL